MMPLNHIHTKCTGVKNFTKLQKKFYHLMHLDDLKLSTKKEKELDTLIQTIRIYSQNTRMEFGIEKCAMLLMKRQIMDGIEQQNQAKIRTPQEKETYKCLGILEADTIKQVEIKNNNFKRVSQTNKKTSRNQTAILLKGMNIWGDPLAKY